MKRHQFAIRVNVFPFFAEREVTDPELFYMADIGK